MSIFSSNSSQETENAMKKKNTRAKGSKNKKNVGKTSSALNHANILNLPTGLLIPSSS